MGYFRELPDLEYQSFLSDRSSSQEYLNSLSNMNKLQESINAIMKDLSETQQDTAAYKENMAMLSQNLSDLNNVYGNMLRAMKG